MQTHELAGHFKRWYGTTFRESLAVQTAATLIGSLALFLSAIPMSYNIRLFGSDISASKRTYALGFASALFGVFFSIPFRLFFVLRNRIQYQAWSGSSCRPWQVSPLPTDQVPAGSEFPALSSHENGPVDASAAANRVQAAHLTAQHSEVWTIHSYEGKSTTVVMNKTRANIIIVSVGMMLSVIWCILAHFAPGLFGSWHVFAWLYGLGWTDAQRPENWGWFISWSPAFFGAGMIFGPRLTGSMMLGSVLSWGLVGPVLVGVGLCAGVPSSSDPNVIQYFTPSPPSPRNWMLWPGATILLCAALTEIVLNIHPIWTHFKHSLEIISMNMASLLRIRLYVDEKRHQLGVAAEDMMPAWQWLFGLTISFFMVVVTLNAQFPIPAGDIIFGFLCAFIFAFVGIENANAAEGDILNSAEPDYPSDPSGPKDSEDATLGSKTSMDQPKPPAAMRPTIRAQCCSTLLGSIIGMILAGCLLILMANAYPCLLDLNLDEGCAFDLLGIGAWSAITKSLTSDSAQPIQLSSAILSLVLVLIYPALEYYKRRVPWRYRRYLPSPPAVGIAMLLGGGQYSVVMSLGVLTALLWERVNVNSWLLWGWALATGLIFGEGIAAIFTAGLKVGGVVGGAFVTPILCPASAQGCPRT
ncbi:uncharacterized protein BJ171DRAFT_474694 [Polychytrium aggregatum]|uniref:uncharacterized protein n=1 Tax=Polychytrium aggregatum TaxID=110093 RepID=UPI0022FDEF70|nr:uncharacterized protein BJ171DRAFT_474694 [Polychytrium aggregatum]KAI9204860.1 hypothetical protein BJ171DRAFT_474694 [Polychytrium aggregatum]